MATKPPAKVKEYLENSLEKIAYESVKEIPTVEPNDAYRLGYNIFQCLSKKEIKLKEAIKLSSARMLISEDEAYKKISDYLLSRGIKTD